MQNNESLKLYNIYNPYRAVIRHSGIKGMRWGIRRYQNEDGSLTPEGRKRYGVGDGDGDSSSNKSNESKPKYERVVPKHERKQKFRDINDDDLQNRINRLRMEQQYINLKNDVDEKSMGFMHKTLRDIGQRAVSGITNYVVGSTINKLVGADVMTSVPKSNRKSEEERELEKWKNKAELAKYKENYSKDTKSYNDRENQSPEERELEQVKRKNALLKEKNDYEKSLETKEAYDKKKEEKAAKEAAKEAARKAKEEAKAAKDKADEEARVAKEKAEAARKAEEKKAAAREQAERKKKEKAQAAARKYEEEKEARIRAAEQKARDRMKASYNPVYQAYQQYMNNTYQDQTYTYDEIRRRNARNRKAQDRWASGFSRTRSDAMNRLRRR